MVDSVESLTKKPDFVDIITYDDYKAQSDDVIIKMLRYRHLLITGGPKPTYGFDKTGLSKLAPINKAITIHGLFFRLVFLINVTKIILPLDHSIELTNNMSPNHRHVAGTLKDFLTAATDKNGKALNGLDFPFSFEIEQDLPFASDKIAWHQVQGEPFCKDDCPTTSIRWALCATSGAYHRSHCDCHGHGTYISPESGIKIWFIGVPKRKPTLSDSRDSSLFEDFAHIDLFTQKYSLNESNVELWDWEVLVLKPGMRLFVFPINIYFNLY